MLYLLINIFFNTVRKTRQPRARQTEAGRLLVRVDGRKARLLCDEPRARQTEAGRLLVRVDGRKARLLCDEPRASPCLAGRRFFGFHCQNPVVIQPLRPIDWAMRDYNL